MNFTAYVAAPFADGLIVRMVHERFVALGITPTSTWAEEANGPEDFARFAPVELRRIAERNDRDLRGSHAVLLIARDGAGGESFAEARMAIEWGKPVVWVGRLTISAWRRGVVRAADLNEGIETIAALREHHASGLRGDLLAAAATTSRTERSA